MLKLCSVLVFNSVVMITRIFSANTFNCNNIMRHSLIFDEKMPSLYIDKNIHVDQKHKNSIYSIEHIFPRSLLNKKDCNDMHNTIRTFNDLNVNRSNYKYADRTNEEKHWIKLDYDNYVNHKLKLFVPNPQSRGIISRAILYMSREYDYNPRKIIDKDVLLNWFFTHPPDKFERYHNEVIKKLQHKNNIFISGYSKETKSLLKYLDRL
jgi:endonuclease I